MRAGELRPRCGHELLHLALLDGHRPCAFLKDALERLSAAFRNCPLGAGSQRPARSDRTVLQPSSTAPKLDEEVFHQLTRQCVEQLR